MGPSHDKNGQEMMKHSPAKPYAMLGAGELASSIWKSGNELVGWRYHFNIFRLAVNGRTGQKLKPTDLRHLVKLAQVLAATLADDGCLEPSVRRELRELASRLDEISNP